jgi:hypothetical protein
MAILVPRQFVWGKGAGEEPEGRDWAHLGALQSAGQPLPKHLPQSTCMALGASAWPSPHFLTSVPNRAPNGKKRVLRTEMPELDRAANTSTEWLLRKSAYIV